MHLSARLLLPVALALTVVPGLSTIAKAEPTSKPPRPAITPVLAHPAPAIALPLSLPRCARPAQTKLLAQIKCKPNDSACICDPKKSFLTKLLVATGKVCGVHDQKAVKEFGAVYCGVDPSKVKGPLGTTSSTAAKKGIRTSASGGKDTTCSSSHKVGVERKTTKPMRTHITLPHNPTLTYECSPLPSKKAAFGTAKKVGNETKKVKTGKKGKHGMVGNGTANHTGSMLGDATSGRMENPLGGGLSVFGVVILVGAVFVMEWVFGEI